MGDLFSFSRRSTDRSDGVVNVLGWNFYKQSIPRDYFIYPVCIFNLNHFTLHKAS